MEAYKILTQNGGSVPALWSMWDDEGHRIIYAGNGFKNVPPPGWGPLAAFRTKEDAVAHARSNGAPGSYRNRMLYRCEVELSKEQDVRFHCSRDDVLSGVPVEFAPAGTIACDSIILLDRIPCEEVESS